MKQYTIATVMPLSAGRNKESWNYSLAIRKTHGQLTYLLAQLHQKQVHLQPGEPQKQAQPWPHTADTSSWCRGSKGWLRPTFGETDSKVEQSYVEVEAQIPTSCLKPLPEPLLTRVSGHSKGWLLPEGQAMEGDNRAVRAGLHPTAPEQGVQGRPSSQGQPPGQTSSQTCGKEAKLGQGQTRKPVPRSGDRQERSIGATDTAVTEPERDIYMG